jgi:cytochrome bd-type quinol oxidase subunit 2
MIAAMQMEVVSTAKNIYNANPIGVRRKDGVASRCTTIAIMSKERKFKTPTRAIALLNSAGLSLLLLNSSICLMPAILPSTLTLLIGDALSTNTLM